ncbi:hypothetical protein LTR60_006298, partial [Cryomyces antarcticus]
VSYRNPSARASSPSPTSGSPKRPISQLRQLLCGSPASSPTPARGTMGGRRGATIQNPSIGLSSG